MLQKLSLMPLLLYLSLAFSGCKDAPKVTVCVSEPTAGGLQCYNESTGEFSFVAYKDSDKYIAMPETDEQTLLDYCSLNSNPNPPSGKGE